MSYQIYYDRAYVRVGDLYIPLVNSGSNNCFQVSWKGRYIAEKYWSVLNWKRRGRLLFTEAEIREIARDYELNNHENGMCNKSRNVCFAAGEFERWIINGMKRAYTIEEYISFGNGFYILDYSDYDNRVEYPVRSTEDLLRIIELLKDTKEIEFKLNYNRGVERPKQSKTRSKPLRPGDLPEHFVLKGDMHGKTIYFIRLTKYGFKYVPERPGSWAKIFRTEKEALRYLKTYDFRLKGHADFTAEKITAA